jgi:hypothetical protein
MKINDKNGTTALTEIVAEVFGNQNKQTGLTIAVLC